MSWWRKVSVKTWAHQSMIFCSYLSISFSCNHDHHCHCSWQWWFTPSLMNIFLSYDKQITFKKKMYLKLRELPATASGHIVILLGSISWTRCKLFVISASHNCNPHWPFSPEGKVYSHKEYSKPNLSAMNWVAVNSERSVCNRIMCVMFATVRKCPVSQLGCKDKILVDYSKLVCTADRFVKVVNFLK